MSLTVHSVFDNTINLYNDLHFVALSHDNSSLTPISIKLAASPKYFKSLGLKQGDEVRINHQGIHLKDQVFSLKEAQHKNLKVTNVTGLDLHEAFKRLNEAIDIYLKNKGKGLLHLALKLLERETVPKNMHIKAFKNGLEKLYETREPREVIDIIKSFSGLGEGLTPSGDDMITGVFATLYAFRSDPFVQAFLMDLKSEMEFFEHSTTDVSKTYLEYAFKGHFNEHVKALFTALDKDEPLLPNLNKIGELGHSSGTDFIIGLKIGLHIGGIIYDS